MTIATFLTAHLPEFRLWSPSFPTHPNPSPVPVSQKQSRVLNVLLELDDGRCRVDFSSFKLHFVVGSRSLSFFEHDELLCDLASLLISHISARFWKTWRRPSFLLVVLPCISDIGDFGLVILFITTGCPLTQLTLSVQASFFLNCGRKLWRERYFIAFLLLYRDQGLCLSVLSGLTFLPAFHFYPFSGSWGSPFCIRWDRSFCFFSIGLNALRSSSASYHLGFRLTRNILGAVSSSTLLVLLVFYCMLRLPCGRPSDFLSFVFPLRPHLLHP